MTNFESITTWLNKPPNLKKSKRRFPPFKPKGRMRILVSVTALRRLVRFS